MTVSLNNVTIGTGSVISNVAGRRRLLALTSDFLISITVPAATQPGSLVSAVYKYAIQCKVAVSSEGMYIMHPVKRVAAMILEGFRT